MKYEFSVAATISLNVDVEADNLDEAIEKAQNQGVISLCHQCASKGEWGEWYTNGELDCDPGSSPLVGLYIDGEEDDQALIDAKKIWR